LATAALPQGVYLLRATLVDGRVVATRWVKG
jgi:hypothetical protein